MENEPASSEKPYRLDLHLRAQFETPEKAREAGERLNSLLRNIGEAATIETAYSDLSDFRAEAKRESTEPVLLGDSGEPLSGQAQAALNMHRFGFINQFSDSVSQPSSLERLKQFSEIRSVQDILVVGSDYFSSQHNPEESAEGAMREALDKLLEKEMAWKTRPEPEDIARICADLNEVHEAALPSARNRDGEHVVRATVGQRMAEAERAGEVPEEMKQFTERFLAAQAAIKGEES